MTLTHEEETAWRSSVAAARLAIGTNGRQLSREALDAIALVRLDPTPEAWTQFEIASARLRQYNTARARVRLLLRGAQD